VNSVMSFLVPQKEEIYWLAKRLSASEKAFFSMELL
jgi:hypothetical protein